MERVHPLAQGIDIFRAQGWSVIYAIQSGYNIYKEHDRWHIVSTNHGREDVECIIKTNGKELHFIIPDNMFENAIDLHMAAYKSAFQPYYHIIG